MKSSMEYIRKNIISMESPALAESIALAVSSGHSPEQVLNDAVIPALISSGRLPDSPATKMLSLFLGYILRPLPAPGGMTSRELVKRSIGFNNPSRIPYSFLLNPIASDFLELSFLMTGFRDRPRKIGDIYTNMWGVKQRVTGRSWDSPLENPLADLSELGSYKFPELAPPDLFIRMEPFVRLGQAAGKYIIAGNPYMMFETMRQLMGFEGLMVAHYTQPEGLMALLDKLTTMTIELIEGYGRIGGIDGVMTWEDWGLQDRLQMRISAFREYYKPFYQRIINAAHKNGMHFIWHNCGYILEMLPDMIEMGVDVLQLDQPRLIGHQKLIDAIGGKLCMWNCVDIQWSVSEGVTDDDIRHEIDEMLRMYDVNRYGGGFMAKSYSSPQDINLSPERQKLIYETFMAKIVKA